MAAPLPTAAALRSIGVRVPIALVRLAAAVEAVVGATALATGWRPMAALVGVVDLCFVAFVSVHLLRGGAASSCGCFGEAGAKPDRVHLAITLAGAATGFGAAFWSAPGLVDVVRTNPFQGLVMAGFVVLGCWFTYLALTALPRLDTARAARAAATSAPARGAA